jgi:hypothetical protein
MKTGTVCRGSPVARVRGENGHKWSKKCSEGMQPQESQLDKWMEPEPSGCHSHCQALYSHWLGS